MVSFSCTDGWGGLAAPRDPYPETACRPDDSPDYWLDRGRGRGRGRGWRRSFSGERLRIARCEDVEAEKLGRGSVSHSVTPGRREGFVFAHVSLPLRASQRMCWRAGGSGLVLRLPACLLACWRIVCESERSVWRAGGRIRRDGPFSSPSRAVCGLSLIKRWAPPHLAENPSLSLLFLPCVCDCCCLLSFLQLHTQLLPPSSRSFKERSRGLLLHTLSF